MSLPLNGKPHWKMLNRTAVHIVHTYLYHCQFILYFVCIKHFICRYYEILMPLICFIIPTIIPVYVWNETWENAWFVATLFRYALSLNGILLVNSAAHMWGNKPYDKWDNLHFIYLFIYLKAHVYNKSSIEFLFIWFYFRRGFRFGNWETEFVTGFLLMVRHHINRYAKTLVPPRHF